MESFRVKMLEFYQFGLHELPLGPFEMGKHYAMCWNLTLSPKTCDLLGRTCFYSRSAGPQRIMHWDHSAKSPLDVCRVPAANVKVSSCQIVKSDLRRKV